MHQAYKLKLACPHQHFYPFMTSEFELHYGMPAISTLMYHSALCAGLIYTKLDALYHEAGIARVSKTHFMGFQSSANRRVAGILPDEVVHDDKSSVDVIYIGLG
ncbi:hypothetical protein R1sor_006183 [Riccia sorocarpa]|uniref:Uncharacterized protein n=1 Tax=Riccia sorocarpa TaxID=122646 RepID=A0ABD3HQ75_9MARC